jgi:two-component SAPR family response regulator
MIVFLTAYAKYAVDAFQVRAFGYLVKPVTAEAIRQELEAFFKKRGKRKNFFAQCFGRFGFFAQDRPVLFEREKSRELLAYLIDQRGVFITQPELMDVLWEGRTNTPALRSQLRNIIFYLRQSLAAYGAEAVLISRRNELAVDPSAFSCDYYDFLDGVERAVEQFQGEYMLSYSWGEATTATLVALKEHR